MLKRQLGTLFLATCLILTTVPAVLGGENKQIINIAGDGSGDFNCDGKDDHAQINQALDYAASNPGTIVHFKGPCTYLIGDSLRVSSNTILEGEPGVTIKLAPGLKEQWGGPGSKIVDEKAMFMIKNNSAKNVTIRNLTVDGSQSDYYPEVPLGAYYNNLATLVGCDGLTIQNVTFQNGCNDAMLISKSSNILIDKVTVNKCGHDGVYAHDVKNITVKDCRFINRANSSTRFDTVTNGVFANNDCTTSGGGYAGLELENRVVSIECTGNYFHDIPWGIARVHTSEQNVNVHGNQYENVKNGVLN
jgi:polygalacturonase